MALIAMALCEHGMEGRRSLRGFDGVGFVPSLDFSFREGSRGWASANDTATETPPWFCHPVPRVCLDNWASSQVLVNYGVLLVRALYIVAMQRSYLHTGSGTILVCTRLNVSHYT